MKYQVFVTESAKADIRETVLWWSENRSKEQAEKWYNKILPAISTLSRNPDLVPYALEKDLLPTGLRQLHFGVSSKSTHRIVFTIDSEKVIILRVRHLARRNLTLDDLSEYTE